MNDRILKKPKYKIGDIIVYPNRYFGREDKEESLMEVFQSRIIEAYGLIEMNDPTDILGWSYITEHIDREQEDSLLEEDILYKL